MQMLVKWFWSFTLTAEGKHIHTDACEDAMQAAWDAKDLCGNCSFKRAIKSTSWGRAGRPRKSRKDWKGRREATGRPAFWGRVSKEGKEKVEIEKEPRQYKGWPVWQLHQEQRKGAALAHQMMRHWTPLARAEPTSRLWRKDKGWENRIPSILWGMCPVKVSLTGC